MGSLMGELVPCSNPACPGSGWHRSKGSARLLCESVGANRAAGGAARTAVEAIASLAPAVAPRSPSLRESDLWSGLTERFAASYDPAAHEGPGRLDPVRDSRLVAMVIDANEELSDVVSEGRAFGPGEYDDLDEEIDVFLTSEGYDTDDLAAAIVAYREAHPSEG